MKSVLSRLNAFLDFIEPEKENPKEPFYDPTHLASVLISSLAVIGVLYWLLWTLLVYEGGLPLKIRDLCEVVFSAKKLAGFGWQGWDDPGDFRGWVGNLGALVIAILVITAIHRFMKNARHCREDRK